MNHGETNLSHKPKGKYSGFIKGVNEFIAGSLGGMLGIAVGHPADTIRVRMQTQTNATAKYNNFLQSVKTIIQKEKFSGLFKGLLSPLLGEMGILTII